MLSLVPSSLSAATITFEQPFTLRGSVELHGGGALTGIRLMHGFGGDFIVWAVPVFDPALGIVESLLLQAPTTIDVTVTLEEPQDAILMTPIIFYDNVVGGIYSGIEGFAGGHIAFPPGSPQFH